MGYARNRAILATPIGSIVIEGDDRNVTAIGIGGNEGPGDSEQAPDGSPVAQATRQLQEYFAGTRRSFDLPLAAAASPRGGVLRGAIASIPYGATATYGALARAHGSGARAVGGACRRNPYPIVVPCHRVTSGGNAAERYSAGDGPTTKAWLIAHEARFLRGE